MSRGANLPRASGSPDATDERSDMTYTDGPYPEKTEREATPLSDAIGNLFDHAERVNLAVGRITERLQPVLRPSEPSLTGERDIAAVRTTSPYTDRLLALDMLVVGFADRINDLSDRLDV